MRHSLTHAYACDLSASACIRHSLALLVNGKRSANAWLCEWARRQSIRQKSRDSAWLARYAQHGRCVFICKATSRSAELAVAVPASAKPSSESAFVTTLVLNSHLAMFIAVTPVNTLYILFHRRVPSTGAAVVQRTWYMLVCKSAASFLSPHLVRTLQPVPATAQPPPVAEARP